LNNSGGCEETATRVDAKFMNAIAAVRLLTRHGVQLLEGDYPISFRVETAVTVVKNP
jgi:hypothetical protein